MLASDEVAVWYWRTSSLTAAEVDSAITLLSPDERRRCDRFVFEHNRRDFAAAHQLIRSALSCHLGKDPSTWQFGADEFGKPVLTSSGTDCAPLCFNLTHTDGLVACAIAHVDVGIDIEHCDRGTAIEDIVRKYFASVEADHLQTCDTAEYRIRFTELWTLKECYSKAIGRGLSINWQSFAFIFEGSSRLRFDSRDRRPWQFWLAELSSSRLAVAAGRQPCAGPFRISFHDASADGIVRSPRMLRSG